MHQDLRNVFSSTYSDMRFSEKKNSPVQLEKWMYLHMIIDMAKTGKSRGPSQTEMQNFT